MRGPLFNNAEVTSAPGAFTCQNDRMLKVDLAGTDGYFFARQGSMVAYQGDVDFAYQGSGGMAKMFKKAVTGEGMSLMKISGSGQVFLAHQADEVAVVELEGDSCTVNGGSVLAFTSGLVWDIDRAEGASVFSGVFSTPPSPVMGCSPSPSSVRPSPCGSTSRPTWTCKASSCGHLV